nr:uncharacterized protein LOC129163070 isoform X2 [Nothobranchius furzeri]
MFFFFPITERAMKDARIDRAIGVCKKVFSTFSYSWKKKKELAKAQKALSVQQDGVQGMQWFPESSSSRRLLPRSSLKTGEPGTSSPHGRTLMSLSKTLGPLVDFTDALSGEKYETPVMQMPAESDDTEEAKKKRRKKGLGSFFKVPEGTSPVGVEPALHPDEAIALEPQAYLQAVTLDTEEDPLEWWKQSPKLFPKLSLLAKKYLCIPATSASSEGVFSTGGNIVTCLRASLTPDHVNRLVFLAKNLT